jgi:hypothetical protein
MSQWDRDVGSKPVVMDVVMHRFIFHNGHRQSTFTDGSGDRG